MAKLADTLRKAIRDADVTIYRIAKDIDVASTVIARFNKGERDLTVTTAQKLCDYFDLELRPREKAKRPARRRRK